MAKAIVTAVRGSGQVARGATDLIATVYFSGTDVENDVEGHPQEVPVRLGTNYTLAELKAGMLAAVQTRGAELGLALDPGDVDLLSFETAI